MNYNELIEILKEKFELSSIKIDKDSPKIIDIKLLDNNQSQWEKNILYVGNHSNLKNPPTLPIMLISIDKYKNLPDGISFCQMRNEDFYDLFNMAKDLIFEDLRNEVMLLELAQAALDGRSIIYIINTAAKLIGNAIILVDAGMKILAHSTNFEIMDPLWAQNIEMGFYSYEFMKKVGSTKQMKEWVKQGHETQIITLPGDLQPKLVARITQNDHLIGALVMIEHHTPIKHHHFNQLPLIGRILFDTFSEDTPRGVNRQLHSSILYNFLDEVELSETLELIQMSKVSFPKEMYVVVSRFIRPIKNRYLKRSIRVEFERIFPNGYSVQYKSYIAILVTSLSDVQKEKLNEVARNEDISIGISWSFSDIIEFKRYFNQAVASIKQAQRFNKTNEVFDYTNYAYFDLLFNYTGKTPLRNYSHPALKMLHEYDIANNTELYLTLKTYLENNKNLRATAEALFIHRNSLVYRISRINELTDIDLNNINVVYSLMDSFRIETYLNSIEATQ